MIDPAWPTLDVAETLRRLTAPGAPFEMRDEIVNGVPVRTYTRALPNLRIAFDASRQFADRPFLVFGDERLSFGEHWRQATAFGHHLLARGIKKGDRVAIAMRNYPEWSVCAWGTIAIGAVLVALNAWESADTLAGLVAVSGARLIVVDDERRAMLAGRLPAGVAMLDCRVEGATDGLPCVLAGGEGGSPDTPLPDPGLAPDDLAVLFFTSGTTGGPKGVPGTHRALATNLVNIGFRGARAAVRRGDPAEAPAPASASQRCQLLPLPLFHVTGFHSSLVPALVGGTRIVLMHKWDVKSALRLIERERVNVLTLVPSQAVQLLDAIDAGAGEDVSSVDTVGYGGAAASPALAARVRTAFPAALAGQGYGATECASLVAANSAEDMLLRPGSVGLVAPVCDVQVTAADGSALPAGATGELWVRGPNVATGYWQAPEATQAAFVDGWYRTGDIGTIDDDGFITILDRLKDMLIRGGENIHCVEIEDVLERHPAVLEAAVVGVPDRVLGELVGAVVVVGPDRIVTRTLLDEHVAALPRHKRPVAYSIETSPLPRNAAGKVIKRDLKNRFAVTEIT